MPKILVVGGCNADVVVRPQAAVVHGTSNRSDIAAADGGVGRNLAENFARLGCAVTFVTHLASEPVSTGIRERLEKMGVQVLSAVEVPAGRYVAVLDPDGSLHAGFCDVDTEALTPAAVDALGLDWTAFDGAVLEANLSEETLTALARTLRAHGVPFALEPVSAARAPRLRESLAGCALVKPDPLEASALSGMPCGGRAEALACARELRRRGAGAVLVSLGAEGFVLSDGDVEQAVDAEPVNGANCSGAGDALLAGYFAARLAGLDPGRAAAVSARCAALACRVSGPVSPELSPDLLR
ncbi:MAG: hypothetical protein KA419_16045 [Acidobacteria bacterium]|nr:hypothetical protein [Acidobacteriota bacterium]